jgi:hypothetical protein
MYQVGQECQAQITFCIMIGVLSNDPAALGPAHRRFLLRLAPHHLACQQQAVLQDTDTELEAARPRWQRLEYKPET